VGGVSRTGFFGLIFWGDISIEVVWESHTGHTKSHKVTLIASFPIWRYVDKGPCNIHEATLIFSTRVSNIQKALKDNGFILSTYIEKVLKSPQGTLEAWESLISNMQPICAALCSIDTSGVFGMMVLMVSKRLSREILGLSQIEGGLHFNAMHCISKYIEGSFMEETAQTIQENAPYTWQMIQQLLDANPSRRRIQPETCDPEVMDEEILI
jgi:hypothetical protein